MPRLRQATTSSALGSVAGRTLPVIIYLNGEEVLQPARFPGAYWDEMSSDLKVRYQKYSRDCLIDSSIVADTEEAWCRYSAYVRMGRDTHQVIERNGREYVVLDIDIPIDKEALSAIRIWILYWQSLTLEQPTPKFEPDLAPGWEETPLLSFIISVYRAADLLQITGWERDGSSLQEELLDRLQISKERKARDELEDEEIEDWIEARVALHKGMDLVEVDTTLVDSIEEFLADVRMKFDGA